MTKHSPSVKRCRGLNEFRKWVMELVFTLVAFPNVVDKISSHKIMWLIVIYRRRSREQLRMIRRHSRCSKKGVQRGKTLTFNIKYDFIIVKFEKLKKCTIFPGGKAGRMVPSCRKIFWASPLVQREWEPINNEKVLDHRIHKRKQIHHEQLQSFGSIKI